MCLMMLYDERLPKGTRLNWSFPSFEGHSFKLPSAGEEFKQKNLMDFCSFFYLLTSDATGIVAKKTASNAKMAIQIVLQINGFCPLDSIIISIKQH